MLNMAVTQPCGSEMTVAAAVSNIPHSVGKLSELIPALTDMMLGLFHG